MGQINLQFHARRKETELFESSMGGLYRMTRLTLYGKK